MNNQYVYAGYAFRNSLGDVTPDQAKKLTHLNIAFGLVEGNRISVEQIKPVLIYLPQIRRYSKDLNIMLSIGGGGAKGFGEATKPENIGEFVDSLMEVVREYELDGIDCDWEFPGDTGNVEEGPQHMELMRMCREELDKYAEERGRKCYLTIAAGMLRSCLSIMDFKGLCDYLDFINVMTYDSRWQSKLTGHHTNLFTPEDKEDFESVEWAIEALHDVGVPYNKLVVGAAFYSHRYDGVQGGGNGLGQPYEHYSFGPNYTQIACLYEKNTDYIKYWDDTCKAPWLFNGYSFITYDDPQSMRCKCEYVKEKGLRGMMYWSHGGDSTNVLFNSIYDNLML